MNRIVSVALLGACLLAISTVAGAQDCSNLTNSDLRGTYSMNGAGFVDLSKAFPSIPGMPTGLVPMRWVGAATFDGVGGGGGWVSFNAAGNQMSATFVNKKYSVKSDCSIQVTYSMKINEMPGLIIGPFTHLMVPVLKQNAVWWLPPESVELHLISVGTTPGTPPGALVDSGVMYRISAQN